MEPTLKNGSLALVNRWVYFFQKPQSGNVVVFKNPARPQEILCKRISAVSAETKKYELRGDNLRDSFDSKNFGTVKKEQILGKVMGY